MVVSAWISCRIGKNDHFRWSPTYDVSAILTSIQSLLPDPNVSSPANAHAAQLFTNEKAEYERQVRKTVEESWLEDLSSEEEPVKEQ